MISACQSPLLSYWHPDWRKRTSSLTVLASPFTATDIKSSSIFSLKRRTWWTVQILLSFCTGLEFHSMNPKIGDCSLTAPSNCWNVFCFTTATSLPLYPLLTQYTEGEVWSSEVCAGENLLWSAWVAYLCWPEDGEFFVGTTVWLHQVPMLSVHVG